MPQSNFFTLLSQQLSADYNVSSVTIQVDNARISNRKNIHKNTTIKDCRWCSEPSQQQMSDNSSNSIDGNSNHSDSGLPSLPRRSITPPSGHVYDVMRGSGGKLTQPERKPSPTSSSSTRNRQNPLPRIPRRQLSNRSIVERSQTQPSQDRDVNVNEVCRVSSQKKKKNSSFSKKIVTFKDQQNNSWPKPQQLSLRDAMIMGRSRSTPQLNNSDSKGSRSHTDMTTRKKNLGPSVRRTQKSPATLNVSGKSISSVAA